MLDPGTYTATLDRIEGAPGGDLAVLVVERDGDPVSQLDLPIEVVPGDGQRADAVFEVVVDRDRFTLTHRPDETERRAASAQSRFDRLARRPPSQDDDSDREGENERDTDGDPENVVEEEIGDASEPADEPRDVSEPTDEPERTSRDEE